MFVGSSKLLASSEDSEPWLLMDPLARCFFLIEDWRGSGTVSCGVVLEAWVAAMDLLPAEESWDIVLDVSEFAWWDGSPKTELESNP